MPRQNLGEGSKQPQDGVGVHGGEEREHGKREPLICFLAALAASFHRCIVTFPCPPALNSPPRPCPARVCSSFLPVLRETCSNADPFLFSPPLAFLPSPHQAQKQFLLFGVTNWGEQNGCEAFTVTWGMPQFPSNEHPTTVTISCPRSGSARPSYGLSGLSWG